MSSSVVVALAGRAGGKRAGEEGAGRGLPPLTRGRPQEGGSGPLIPPATVFTSTAVAHLIGKFWNTHTPLVGVIFLWMPF